MNMVIMDKNNRYSAWCRYASDLATCLLYTVGIEIHLSVMVPLDSTVNSTEFYNQNSKWKTVRASMGTVGVLVADVIYFVFYFVNR